MGIVLLSSRALCHNIGLISRHYIGAETYYNRQLGWSAQDERELMALLDRLDAYGIRYALSAVRSYGGEANEVLEQWLAHGTKTHRIIRRDAQDAEKVLVLNY